MCEQTEVHYLEGDVVWVKLGACWWPGKVRDVDKLPDDIIESFRKKPIAAVQFFNEDKYEFVKNLDQICRYNCRRKLEFIKKGLDMFRIKQKEGSSFMDKFPSDVSMAEQMTGGNPDIVTDNTFAPEEKPNYDGIFGNEKKAEKKGKKTVSSPLKGSPTWRNKLGSPSTPAPPLSSPRRPITHPRIIRMLKGEEEQHDVRIRQQPATPQRESSPQSEPYKCYKCDFTSKRLNVVILHSKSHSSDGATNGQDAKHVRSKSTPSAVTPHRGRGRPRGSHSGSVGRPAKNSPKATSVNSTDACEAGTPKSASSVVNTEDKVSKETLPQSEKKTPKTPTFGKRKNSKTAGDKASKKKKSSEDFKEKLLAEWEDEDQEEEEKEMMILKQELSKSEALSSPGSERGSERANYSTNKVTSSSNVKPKEISCFDFDEKADSLLDHELEERAKKFAEARKFPRRLDEKMDTERRTEIAETNTEISKTKDIPLKEKEEVTVNNTEENKDLSEEFEKVLAETELPSLPEVPNIKAKISERETVVSPELEDAVDNRVRSAIQDYKKQEESAMLPLSPTIEHAEELSKSQEQQSSEATEEAAELCEVSDQPTEIVTSGSSIEAQRETTNDTQTESHATHSTDIQMDMSSSAHVESSPVEPTVKLPSENDNLSSELLLTEPLVQDAALEHPQIATDKLSKNEPMNESHFTSVPKEQAQISVIQEPKSLPLIQESNQVLLDQQQIPVSEEQTVSVTPATAHVSVLQETVQTSLPLESRQVSVMQETAQLTTQDSMQMSLDEMELDINSMPVVMGDTLITEDSTTKLSLSTVASTNSVAITLPPPVIIEKNPPAGHDVMRIASVSTTSSTSKVTTSGTVTLNVTPTLELVTEASTSVVKSSAQTTTANSAPKIVKQVVKSVKIQPGPSGTALRTADGSIITPKGTGGTNRYVLIQHPSGKQTIYTTTSAGKTGQQCVAVKTGASQSQGAQQSVSKKLVIVKSPQGTTVSPEVLSSLQQGLSSGGKLVPQRIITSQGTILKQVGKSSSKVMRLTPQQMKAVTVGKQVGSTKLTMQSTPTKVVLPTVQKMVSHAQGMKVVASATAAKSKPNTILIQTTQGTSLGTAIVSRAVAGNATGTITSVTKLAGVPQTVVRQVGGTSRSKIVATASSGSNVQRVVVSTAGRGAVLQGQAQQKVLAARSGVQPRMLMQKGRGTSTVRVPNVGAIAGLQTQVTQVQQVKKVQGVLPRAQVLQKGKQGQIVQKVVTVQQPGTTAAIKATSSTEATQSIVLPSLQPLQPEVSTASVHQNLQSGTLVLTSAPAVINQNLVTSQNATVPVATSAPLLSHEHIAQVIAPAGSEQLGEGATPTYVLVTIDDQGALQPYDSSGLVTSFDSGNQNPESNTRTLYIDPASLGTSGDLENIFLAINNTGTSGSGTLLNLGQSNAVVSGANVATTQHSQTVFNITGSQQATPPASQDILAAALANTDVFQTDGSITDSLTVVNSSQAANGSVMTSRLLEPSSLLPASTSSSLHQTTVLLPSLSATAMPPANPAGVLETSLTLNQPIMTPLEVPSSVTNLQQPAPPIPTSLELPLTITQPVLSMPATSPFSALSQQSNLQHPESESVDSPISSSSISQNISQTVLSSRPTLQPSMPLLSEDVSDSQAAVVTGAPSDQEMLDHQPGSSCSLAQTTSEHDQENLVASNSEQVSLPSYAQVPEVSSHATEEHDITNKEANYGSDSHNQLSDHVLSTSYHDIPESTSEASASDGQGVVEMGVTQSASEQTVSTSFARNLQDTVPKERTEDIDSSNPPAVETPVPNYSMENSSEAVASTHDLSTTDETHVPYEEVESTSQLQEASLGEAVTEVTQPLPSESTSLHTYAPTPESTSGVAGEILENNSSGVFSLPSYSQTPESTCEMQEEKEIASNQSASGSYAQVPESTSHVTESHVVGDSPMDILDSSQHSLDSSVLTPYQVPESSSEASVVSYEDAHGTSSVSPPNSHPAGYTSCSQVPESTSQMHEVLTFSDSSTEVSDCAVPLAQSMPLLLDTGPDTVGTKRHLDGEGVDNPNDLDHSKKVKIDESERIKDQVSPSSCLHFPTPDSPSLQKSEECIESDDDDLPSPYRLQSTSDKKDFSQNDIVWMKVNQLYVPGVVIGVKRKQEVALVKFINSPIHEKAFCKPYKDLLHFTNNSRNRQFLEEGKKNHPEVQEAFEKITEFYYKNYKAGGTLSAVRYLTYDENDKYYGYTNVLEALETEGDTIEQNKNDEDGNYSNVTEVSERMCGNQDDESIPQEVISQKEMEREAKQLLNIIKSSECKEHLARIFRGTEKSLRHSLFMTKDYKIQEQLIFQAGIGPFSNKMGLKMVGCVDKYLKNIDNSNTITNCGSRNEYLFNVFVPEALIFAICKFHNLNYENAEERFRRLSR